MTPDQLALLADARLSREARIMGLHIASLGEGAHAIAHSAFRRLLGRGARGMAKDDTIGGYIQELVEYGWVTREPGGQGSPRYTFAPPPRGSNPDAFLPLESSPPPPWGGKAPVSPTTMGGQTAPTSSSSKEPPLPPPLEARARAFVESSEVLVGCRGSLLDYLAERVETDRQLAYAQSVAGTIEGTDEQVWMARDGSHVRENRAAIVAGCLNDLRAGDEVGKYFPGPPGDPRNLKSKVRYKVKSLTDARRDAKRERSSGPPEAPRGEPRPGGPRPSEQRVDVVR